MKKQASRRRVNASAEIAIDASSEELRMVRGSWSISDVVEAAAVATVLGILSGGAITTGGGGTTGGGSQSDHGGGSGAPGPSAGDPSGGSAGPA